MKLLQRKFAVPASANLIAVINEAAGLGYSFKVMCLLVAGSLIYAAIEQWGDTTRAKYGTAPKKPAKKPADPTG